MSLNTGMYLLHLYDELFSTSFLRLASSVAFFVGYLVGKLGRYSNLGNKGSVRPFLASS